MLGAENTLLYQNIWLVPSAPHAPHSDKEIDFSTVDLKKLRVKELKKILSNWGEDCRGCAEKTDFISKINAVKHQHVEL